MEKDKSEEINTFLNSLRDIAKCSDEAFALLLNQLEAKDISSLISGMRKVQQHKQQMPIVKKRKTKAKNAQNACQKKEGDFALFYSNIQTSVLDLKHHEGSISLLPDLGTFFRNNEKGERSSID